jgi:hypothetical protein
MKWDLFWVVIYSYRRGLINRQEFIKHWQTMQQCDGIIDG